MYKEGRKKFTRNTLFYYKNKTIFKRTTYKKNIYCLKKIKGTRCKH